MLIHEIVHYLLFLIRPSQPKAENPLESLNFMVFEEGIAHFIGYPGEREREDLLEKHSEKWSGAEEKLAKALEQLSSPQIEEALKKELLRQAGSGNYWEKFASISGLFRAAAVYQKQGSNGLINCIKTGILPKVEQS